jgi:hypothetical protein
VTGLGSCDRCDKSIASGEAAIDVWDENAAWLRYCSWRCVYGTAFLRRLGE